MYGGNRGYHPHLVRSEFVSTDDSDGEQAVKLFGLDGEVLSNVYRPQHYGLSSYAPTGSHGVLVSFGGERNQSFLLGGELPQKRPTKANEGDVKLYDQTGNVIFMAQKNGISLSTANGDAVVRTSKGAVRLTADGHVFAQPSDGNNVYLGMDSPGGSPVMTKSGPSRNVYALV